MTRPNVSKWIYLNQRLKQSPKSELAAFDVLASVNSTPCETGDSN